MPVGVQNYTEKDQDDILRMEDFTKRAETLAGISAVDSKEFREEIERSRSSSHCGNESDSSPTENSALKEDHLGSKNHRNDYHSKSLSVIDI